MVNFVVPSSLLNFLLEWPTPWQVNHRLLACSIIVNVASRPRPKKASGAASLSYRFPLCVCLFLFEKRISLTERATDCRISSSHLCAVAVLCTHDTWRIEFVSRSFWTRKTADTNIKPHSTVLFENIFMGKLKRREINIQSHTSPSENMPRIWGITWIATHLLRLFWAYPRALWEMPQCLPYNVDQPIGILSNSCVVV